MDFLIGEVREILFFGDIGRSFVLIGELDFCGEGGGFAVVLLFKPGGGFVGS